MKNKTYLSSLWIANLGVEPLFSIAFFLLRPAFLSLNFLLVLVCVVLDAITLSLKYILKSLFRSNKLTILSLFVKVFIAQDLFAAQINEQNIFLSRGEQHKVAIKSLKKFSVGNKEVISTTYKDGFMYIKGKSIGFSDIDISLIDDKYKYKVFVLNKKEQLKTARTAQGFKSIGIDVQIDEDLISLSGEIRDVNNYFKFMNLLDGIKSKKIIDVKLDLKLRNQLVSKVYEIAYRNGASFVSCENIEYQLYCNFNGLDFEAHKIKQLFSSFFIKRVADKKIKKNSNYIISFKIFKVNKSNEYVRDLGPSSVSMNIKDLLNSGSRTIIDGDLIQIRDSKSDVNVLAQPIARSIINEDSVLNLGGEFPVVTNTVNGPTTQWKFYGLSLKSKLEIKNEKLLLKYSTDLSTPFEQNISTTAGNSVLYVPVNKYVELFKINFNQKKFSNESIPILNRIPILKYLFAKNNRSNTNQEIICFAKIEVQDD